MRYLLLLFAFASCTSPKTNEEKAKIAVKKYLQTRLNDVNSYQAVEFTLDTNLTYLLSEKERVQKLRLADDEQMRIMIRETLKKGGDLAEKSLNYIDSVRKVMNQKAIDKENPWYVYHTFRSKNAFGAIVLNAYNFYLDSNFNVTSAQSIDEY